MVSKDVGALDPGAAFDRYLAELYPDADAREGFNRRVRAVQLAGELMRAMDEARKAAGLSKATVAGRMRRKPAAISRLLAGPDANPTVTTLIELLDAMEFRLEISVKPQPKETSRRRPAILIRSGTPKLTSRAFVGV